jgi:hypothetical protein
MSNDFIKTFIKDWIILKEKVFSEKFTYNNREFYSYYQISGVMNPNLMGGTISFKQVALMIKETNLKSEDEYYLILFDKSLKPEKVVEQFVLEVIL